MTFTQKFAVERMSGWNFRASTAIPMGVTGSWEILAISAASLATRAGWLPSIVQRRHTSPAVRAGAGRRNNRGTARAWAAGPSGAPIGSPRSKLVVVDRAPSGVSFRSARKTSVAQSFTLFPSITAWDARNTTVGRTPSTSSTSQNALRVPGSCRVSSGTGTEWSSRPFSTNRTSGLIPLSTQTRPRRTRREPGHASAARSTAAALQRQWAGREQEWRGCAEAHGVYAHSRAARGGDHGLLHGALKPILELSSPVRSAGADRERQGEGEKSVPVVCDAVGDPTAVAGRG